MKQSEFNTDASHIMEIGGYYPVFYNDFARSAQSVEMLWNALQHTDWKRWFVVYEHDWSAVLFLTIYSIMIVWEEWRKKENLPKNKDKLKRIKYGWKHE